MENGKCFDRLMRGVRQEHAQLFPQAFPSRIATSQLCINAESPLVKDSTKSRIVLRCASSGHSKLLME
jgi:hypothetical protein